MSKPEPDNGPERKKFRGRSIEPRTERQLNQDALNALRGSMEKRTLEVKLAAVVAYKGLRTFQQSCRGTLYAPWHVEGKTKSRCIVVATLQTSAPFVLLV